jgi:pimeloyl-ACP methyl ester carboxylesterase/predicted glycosyltransferase
MTRMAVTPDVSSPPGREQTRARYPDEEGYVERDGVRIHYEVYGDGEPTFVLLPAWSIVHSRFWKMQIPYLARHFRVVTFDGRGNGLSDRPRGKDSYRPEEFAADALAVMDRTGTDRAVMVGLSRGALWGTLLATEHPERVTALVCIGPAVPLALDGDGVKELPDEDLYETPPWEQDFEGFLHLFFSTMFNEPHSTKQIEDAVGWGLGTDAATLTATHDAARQQANFLELAQRVQCPTLVLHGDNDQIRPHEKGAALARATGGRLVTLEGSGHGTVARDPVKVNTLLRDFVAPSPPPPRWRRGAARAKKRALFVSSPIGLGHARRDVAIAQELREQVPGLEIDWLAQNPVTRVLEAEGERIHPASRHLASESGHIESECAEHDLHAFQAIRRMDEILCANFMLFHDVVRDDPYDLWIGDEAWEVDYYLHENPEQKRASYVWLTDFVGWLPMEDGGSHEAFLTADYNAEMIEHIARYPRVRDRSIFVGNEEDVVPSSFGEGLPAIRDWTSEHFSYAGYVTGFDPSAVDREALRAELGYGPREQVCIVTVGGSGVGLELLRRVIDAFPEARERVPSLRMIAVAGPRIDPASLPSFAGLEVRAYVHDLYRHLAACDVAVVQGGLTTSMELTASKRPFLYFPLRHHFEQNFHVRHRLERYGAGRCMDFAVDGPTEIAVALAEELGRGSIDYRPVERDGAARAAAMIAELL